LGIKTRLQGWEIVPAGTHEARKAAEAAARGVGVKTGDSPAPWSSDNNCTRPDPEAFADQIMREQWGLSPFSIDRLRSGASVREDGFTLWLENGQVQSSRALPSELDWELDGQPPAEQSQLDEYAVPDGDEDWPMLVELCGQVYLAQGHAGALRWIEMLPDPYQSEMWKVLEGLDTPEWIQEQEDYSEEWV
ncbi:MAG: replication endonuclease, partial [Aeromonadaceae bacterium]